MSIVVNFIGSPGSGKSTLTAAVFAELKFRGLNVELITEYAKKLAWENRLEGFNDELYIISKQLRELKRPFGKVDIILTDSPILHNIYYSGGVTENIVMNEYSKMKNINYFVTKPESRKYNDQGRIQSNEQSQEIRVALKDMLGKLDIRYSEVLSERNSISLVADDILNQVKELYNNIKSKYEFDKSQETANEYNHIDNICKNVFGDCSYRENSLSVNKAMDNARNRAAEHNAGILKKTIEQCKSKESER